MANWLSSIFGDDEAPKAPDYSPLIGMANANSAYARSKADQITGQYGLIMPGYNAGLAGQGWSQDQAAAARDIMQQQLDWARNTYAQNQGQISPIINAATQYMGQNAANAATDRAFYEGTYQPMMKEFADYASGYDTPERRAQNRGRAMAGVAQNFDAARESSTRALEDFGVNPAATRYAGLDIGVRTQQAAAQAAAASQSDLATEAQGVNLRSAAIGQGAVLPGQVNASYGTGLSSGALAGNEALALTASGANTMGTAPVWGGVSQGYGGLGVNYLSTVPGYLNSGTGMSNSGANWMSSGNAALGQAGQFTNSGFQNNLSSFKANQESSSGLGSLLGMGGALAMNYFAPGSGTIAKKTGFFDEGGAVPAGASPTGGAAIDDVPARLTPGEFVMPQDVVAWEGEKGMQAIVEKARKARMQTMSQGGAKPKMRQALPVGQPSFVSHPAIAAQSAMRRAPQRSALPVG